MMCLLVAARNGCKRSLANARNPIRKTLPSAIGEELADTSSEVMTFRKSQIARTSRANSVHIEDAGKALS